MSLNPITALLDSIEKLFNEHASAAARAEQNIVLKERLAFLQERFDAMERDNTELREENKRLKNENTVLKTELDNLKEVENTQGDICRYCHKPTGKLLRLEPTPIFGDLGEQRGFYKCEACGGEYHRDHKD